MQRRIINLEPLTPIFLFCGLVVYESISSLYVYITPLVGIVFLYLVQNIHDKEKTYINLALFLYLIFFEIDRGFFVFSSLIYFLIYYNFFHNELVNSVACQNCLKFLIIFLFYIGFYIVNLILSLLFNQDLPIFDITYIIYFVTDFILVLL